MIVIHDAPPERLDLAIARGGGGISRREAKRLLDDTRITVNGLPVRVASREVRAGDRIAILRGVPDLTLLLLEPDRLAVDKPSGLASQMPRRNGPLSVIEVLGAQLERERRSPALWVVHRLDTGTSGVLLFARTRSAAAELSALFARHEFEKTYLARVAGRLERELVLDETIARTGATTFAVAPEGRSARTLVTPLESGRAGSLVSIRITTGRTHQIRVHLASAGFPVAGDAKYGGPPAPRLMLHAWKLTHPRLGTIEAPVPADLAVAG